ncbi:hypothetical protein [Actinomadura sp. WMMB 499]|uniref:hypothetical protein n=1 Tax=Actinomadura sp. WMMB 499 TaxID=1219491 RepID=UPI0020C756DB|nr:hypothetical protein [Actinomadura sp. WMMB 499]
MSRPLPPGDPAHLGPFRLSARLSETPAGIVFLGVDAQGRRASVAVLNRGAAGDAAARDRFRAAINAAAPVPPGAAPVAGGAPVVAAQPDGPAPWVATAYEPDRAGAERFLEPVMLGENGRGRRGRRRGPQFQPHWLGSGEPALAPPVPARPPGPAPPGERPPQRSLVTAVLSLAAMLLVLLLLLFLLNMCSPEPDEPPPLPPEPTPSAEVPSPGPTPPRRRGRPRPPARGPPPDRDSPPRRPPAARAGTATAAPCDRPRPCAAAPVGAGGAPALGGALPLPGGGAAGSMDACPSPCPNPSWPSAVPPCSSRWHPDPAPW